MSDPDPGTLDERLRAVERAVTESDRPPAELADAAEATERIGAIEERVGSVEERLAELEAATEALRGYVGNVRSVNEDVERRADAALSMARTLRSDDGDPTEGRRNGDRSPPGSNADRTGPDGDPTGSEPDGNRRKSERDGDRTPDPNGTAPEGNDATNDRWPTESGPWEPAGREPTETPDASIPRGDDGGPNAVEGPPESTRSTARSGERKGEGDRTWGDTAWPAGKSPGGDPPGADRGDEWPPDGMDVDRAQPWSVPDPGDEEWDHEDDRTLLDRVREAL